MRSIGLLELLATSSILGSCLPGLRTVGPSFAAAHPASAAFVAPASRADATLKRRVAPWAPCRRAKENAGSETTVEEVDVAIVGAGIGGLCAGAILNTLYGKKVGIYESHYLPGGCAHAFERTAKIGDDTLTFTFDSGPTIVLGCSKEPYNPLQQVLRAVGVDESVEWLPYDGWGMIERPATDAETRWKLQVGPNHFEGENGPLQHFARNPAALEEFNALRRITEPLVIGAATLPAMAMRPGPTSLVPLLRYLPSLFGIIRNGVETATGPFGPFINGPIFTVTDPWLRDWLDALAFSLSGLPADRTAAASMAYVLFDMHREGAALDYPRGGLGEVVKALVKGVEQKSKDSGVLGSRVHLRRHVESIEFNAEGDRAVGLNVRTNGGRKVSVRAKEGVICNAPIWSLRKLIKNENALKLLSGGEEVPSKAELRPNQSWTTSTDTDLGSGRGSVIGPRPPAVDSPADSLLSKCDTAEMTGSFLHLHVALDARDLDLDRLQPHYTVMDRGLAGDGVVGDGVADGPCGELNMIAVSNPCVLDRTLAPEGYIVVHAYGAGNEPFDVWDAPAAAAATAPADSATEAPTSGERYRSSTYKALKDSRAVPLWRAIEAIIPDARDRAVVALIGSPLTHARFLRRPRGTYGCAIEDLLKDGSTPIPNLVLAGDGVFPGIGIPAVALSGASAANGMVGVYSQWMCMDELKSRGAIN